MNRGAIVVLTTVANEADAETLARKIVEARLAGCVQILPAMKSIYVWDDAIQSESENLLLIKTLREKYSELEQFIQTHHEYDVPELVALQAEQISENYLGWLKDSLA